MKSVFEERLNPQQLEAVKHIDGPLLVVAGAGSGKTRVITYRMAYLIDQGIPSSRILGLTFTNKAAGEMKERVRSMMYPPPLMYPPPPLVCTFHSFGARVLRTEIHNLGYNSHFVIYDEVDSLRAAKEAVESLKLRDFLSPEQARLAITRQKNEVARDRSVPLKKSSYLTHLRAVSEAYHSILKRNNAVDFDDLILLPLRLFEDFPKVLEDYQNRYLYVLVDEYQDTNAPQYRLVKMLCRNHKNVCVVGDPDQSIYRWRGSDIRNILKFEEDFPGARKVVLERNYRSTSLILNAANSLIRYNQRRATKKLWSELGKGEDVVYFLLRDDKEEADTALEVIRHLVEDNNLRYRDIAVFYRTHAQSRLIEERLRAGKVPYTVVGGVGFYERKEVKDILAYLRILVSPSDSVSFLRVINVPRRGIGKVTLDRLAAAGRQKGVSVYEAAKEADSIAGIPRSAGKSVSSFVKMMEEFREKVSSTPLHKLTEELIKRLGYRRMLEDEFPDDAEDRIDNLRELTDAMKSFHESNPSSGLEEFLEQTSLVSDIDAWQDKENTVCLMTLHNSKGLEFEAVVIVGLEEGIFPHANALNDEDPERLEEERRLCYVGVTRAKRFLYLTAAQRRLRHGMYVENEESRFILEIFPDSDAKQHEDVELPARRTEGEQDRSHRQKSQTPIKLTEGDRVVHPTFGPGTVVSVERHYSEVFVRVLFDGDTEARLLSPSFARLTKA